MTGWHKVALAGFAGVVAFIGYKYYESKKGAVNTQATVTGTTPLNVLQPITTISGAMNDTMVYPISVTDPNALTLADFNYGVSTTPQVVGEQGIPYARYQQLVG